MHAANTMMMEHKFVLPDVTPFNYWVLLEWFGCSKDDEAIGADVGSIRLKFLEVHNEYIKKTQEYDAMYGEHARISQVIRISAITSV